MLVLAYMLRRKSVWRNPSIRLFGVAGTEQEREKKQEEINNLVEKNRLKVKTQILVSPGGTDMKLSLVENFSSHAAMIFMSLRPMRSGEGLEEYARYFSSLPHKSSAFPPVALVMCSTEMNLQEVMNIQSVVRQGE
jgi:hypothetical protein